MTTPAHPPTEDLAAYAAGDLEHAAAGAVSAHVASCAACRDDVAALQRTVAELAALPLLSMPVDVISQVEHAVAAEHAPQPLSATVAPLAPRRRSTSSRRWIPVASAAAVVGLVGAVGLGTLRGRAPQEDATASGGTAQMSADPAGPVLLASGVDYTAAALDGQVRGALAAGSNTSLRREMESSTARSSAGAADSAAEVSEPFKAQAAPNSAPELDAALRSCITELAGSPDVTPLLVDVATYARQPAWIVVLPFRGDRVDVFVVRRDCRVGNDALLLFKRVQRG